MLRQGGLRIFDGWAVYWPSLILDGPAQVSVTRPEPALLNEFQNQPHHFGS
jgi:hypothetical protein